MSASRERNPRLRGFSVRIVEGSFRAAELRKNPCRFSRVIPIKIMKRRLFVGIKVVPRNDSFVLKLG